MGNENEIRGYFWGIQNEIEITDLKMKLKLKLQLKNYKRVKNILLDMEYGYLYVNKSKKYKGKVS